jgi:Tfp pilus assembly protein PilV
MLRLREEDGQALVLAIVIVVVGLLLGLGAVAYALTTHQEATHDERNRAAQQASDAGTQVQLYDSSDSSSVGFNLNGGPLGLGELLDCTIPEISGNVVIGTVQVSANASGACPPACVLSGTGSCSAPPPSTGNWEPVDDETYQESEFFANAEPQQSPSSSSGNGDDVVFPEIVSIGCHTTSAPAAAPASCNDGGSANSYDRQLTLLKPTGPLQAIEGRNDVTVNSSLTSLESLLDAQVQCISVLGLPVCSLTNGTADLLNGLTGLLGLGSVSSIVNSVIGPTILGTGIGIVDGDISAGHDLWLPGTTVNVNTSTNTLSSGLASLGNIGSVLTNIGGTLANPASLFSTFEFGNQVCQVGTPSTCTSSPTAGLAPAAKPVTAIAPNYVSTGSKLCSAGVPSSSCTLDRQSFKLTTGAPTTLTGVTYAQTAAGGTMTYANGMLTVTGDTTANPGKIVFTGGQSYVFCGIEADNNVSLTTSGSGGVQIYVEAPGQNGCPTTAANSAAGNFVVCGGLNNTFASGGLNASSVTGTVNPSGLQIYVQGTSTTYGSGGSLSSGSATLAPGSTDTAVASCPWGVAHGAWAYTAGLSSADPATQVYLGNANNSLLQAAVVYAPGSEVNIQTTSSFEGSAIGWNVDVTALAVLQDLDLGNYPLSSVIGAYQPAETLTCDSSVEALSDSATSNPPQYYTSSGGNGPTTASGGAGDLDGCS